MSEPETTQTGYELVEMIWFGLAEIVWSDEVKSPIAPRGVMACEIAIVVDPISGNHVLHWADAARGPITLLPFKSLEDVFTITINGSDHRITFNPDVDEGTLTGRLSAHGEWDDLDIWPDPWAEANEWAIRGRFERIRW
jgi:hypothetical protein